MTVIVRQTEHNSVAVYREIDAETGETRLYCHSELKAKKEQGIRNRFHVRLETALDKLHAGLDKKGMTKNYAKILERIGRLREQHSRVASNYKIEVLADDEKNNATAIEWKRETQNQLKQQGINLSWDSIRNIMSSQQLLTIILPTDTNLTLHLWTTTKPEVQQQQLFAALSIKPDPLGKCKIVINNKKICSAT